MKPEDAVVGVSQGCQPPSGGCVLKPSVWKHLLPCYCPAAFRRLCVETKAKMIEAIESAPAAFRRLCVETR